MIGIIRAQTRLLPKNLKKSLAIQNIPSVRSYHSYPDENEVPTITHSISSVQKQVDKTGFDLDKKFAFDRPFPGVPQPQGIVDSTIPKPNITKLDNGLTVASQDVPGLMTSFALIVRTGSSYEIQSGNNAETGATNFLELNGFKSTKNNTALQIITEIEKMGGVIQCVSTKENMIYCMDVLKENIEPAFQLFSDIILNPTYPDEELDETRMIIDLMRFELPSEIFSRDLVLRAGFQGQPLGNHHFCPVNLANNVTAKQLHAFREKFYFGENMVLGAAGVDHATISSLAAKYLQSIPKQPASVVKRPFSNYTGGMLTEQRELKEPFMKIAMAFDVGGWKSDQLVAACVLQQLLGGGSSFSAGGPGKGMYTRLYTQVLNRHFWAESVEAFVSIFEENGILGIDGSCPAQNIPHMIKAIVEQFAHLAVIPVSNEELNRAKNMLKSMMMMQLESRLVICEDIARQLITFGYREDPIQLCKKIDAITQKDLMNVASKMLLNDPCVSVVGEDLSHVPNYNDIRRFTKDVYHEVWRTKK